MGKSKIGWAPLYVMRCMSKAEFARYKNGETLRNLNTHGGWKTDSIGFCFFPVSRTCESVEQRLRYLAGIVSLDIVAVFATTPGTWLTRATGWYRNPDFDSQAFNRLELIPPSKKKKGHARPDGNRKSQKKHVAVTDEMVEKMIELRMSGMTYKQIAGEMGVSEFATRRHLKDRPEVANDD